MPAPREPLRGCGAPAAAAMSHRAAVALVASTLQLVGGD
jgi:hypothetical protein